MKTALQKHIAEFETAKNKSIFLLDLKRFLQTFNTGRLDEGHTPSLRTFEHDVIRHLKDIGIMNKGEL